MLKNWTVNRSTARDFTVITRDQWQGSQQGIWTTAVHAWEQGIQATSNMDLSIVV